MELTTFWQIRRLYQSDPHFRQAVQENSAIALLRWRLNASGVPLTVLDQLQPWLVRSPGEVLQAILKEQASEWEGMPVKQSTMNSVTGNEEYRVRFEEVW
jgi:hypothetical protein